MKVAVVYDKNEQSRGFLADCIKKAGHCDAVIECDSLSLGVTGKEDDVIYAFVDTMSFRFNAIEGIKKIRKEHSNYHFIFIDEDNNFIDDALTLNAIGYINKPFDVFHIRRCFEKIAMMKF